jgi:hypothetical protein
MAFQAKQVDLAATQKPWVRRTMRRVAGHAAFGLYGRVLEGKRPGFVSVAIETELVLRVGGSQLMRKESTVRVVAIAAGQKTFIHFVVEWLGEIRFDIKMAGVAKLRLLHFQEPGLYFWRVNGMAINAPNIILDMLRAQKVRVLLAKFMAAQAAL